MSEGGRHFLVTVYYEDTDFSGNVYHASYLKFFERARTEWLRVRGLSHSELAKQGAGFVVRHMEISFDRPAHIDNLLEVETVLESATGARVTLSQVVRRDGEPLVSALVQIAMVNKAGRPMRLPAQFRQP